MLARRAGIKLIYSGVDITKNIEKDLLSFRYTDNASGTADDIQIDLKDEKGIWLKQWFPQKGDILSAEINTINWRYDGDSQKVPCGTFIIDEPEYKGRPRTMSLKAISTPSNSNFTTTKRNRAWQGINIKSIASDIAKKAGLGLLFDSSINPTFTRVEQSDQSDMNFLMELCEKSGLAFKVTNKQIVIFNEADYEKRDIVATFKESSSTVLDYSLKTTLTNTAYAGCRVKYFDINRGKNIEYLFAIKEIDTEKDKIYELNEQVKNEREAYRLAQKTLRKLNKSEYQVSMTVLGNVKLVGGCCVTLKDFGIFDGKYYIDSATHEVGKGYQTSLEMHRVLEGY